MDRVTYETITGHELLEVKTNFEKTKDVQILLNDGDQVLHGKHLLGNAYEIHLFKNGGVIRQNPKEPLL